MITKHARERIDVENKEKIEKRRKVISEKCGQPKDLNGLSDGILKYQGSKYHYFFSHLNFPFIK